jgi:hypothetical protein
MNFDGQPETLQGVLTVPVAEEQSTPNYYFRAPVWPKSNVFNP